MSKEAFTIDRLRADVARLLREEPTAIGLDDNLMDWGLDSMRLLDLITRWNAEGLDVDLMELGGETTLAGWWRVIGRRAG